ncbi:MAG: hypothetical protein LBC86_10025, partial [Oscillospiraceae bacterium]|nr:hypothetical protein [Oscillospiraceae bacterium]
IDDLETHFRENFAVQFRKNLTEDVDGFWFGDNLVECRTHSAQVCEWERDDCEFIIRNITVTHRTADGFVSSVVSDIVVVIPDFSYVRADYPINEIALIATAGLNIPATEVSINNGIAYAGQIIAGGALTINNTTMISSGNVEINNMGNLTVSSDSDLWASRIIVGVEGTGSVSLNGDIYIDDDLELRGAGATAVLAGRYYGFGNSPVNASQSSSIIINAQNSTLDMTELKELFLAGHSFINPPEVEGFDNPAGIFMGQSVSVKSDQLAYLVPANLIDRRTNPIIFGPGETVTPAANVGNHIEPYADIPGIQPVYSVININGENYILLRLFMDFNGDREAANGFFRKYFSDYADEIESYEDYLNTYLSLSGEPDNARTSGVYYYADEDGGLQINQIDEAEENLRNLSNRLQRMYKNITRSLSTSIQADDFTPYSYIVNTARIDDDLDNGEHRFYDGDIVRAVIIKCNGGSLTNTSSLPSSVNLILSTGNVEVGAAEFKGLIISNGTVTLSGDITTAGAEIIPSMRAVNNNRMFGYYLNISIFDDDFSEPKTPSWDMSALVFYENWHKR